MENVYVKPEKLRSDIHDPTNSKQISSSLDTWVYLIIIGCHYFRITTLSSSQVGYRSYVYKPIKKKNM